jgi:hypothetical protein
MHTMIVHCKTLQNLQLQFGNQICVCTRLHLVNFVVFEIETFLQISIDWGRFGRRLKSHLSQMLSFMYILAALQMYFELGHGLWSITKKQLFSLRKLPCDWEVRDHCMCKEMPVIPINRVVDTKRMIRKMVGRRGGEAQGVAHWADSWQLERLSNRPLELDTNICSILLHVPTTHKSDLVKTKGFH